MDTKTKILDATEQLIQQRGFSGFSFQDVADAVGIKKASIYYYYPAKGELGGAVVARYRQRMRGSFDKLDTAKREDFWPLLETYLGPMALFGKSSGVACLSGVLGGEFLNLPPELQKEIAFFFDEHEDFFTLLLERGRRAGAFHFSADPRSVARLLFSALEGALLIKRIKHDETYFAGLLEHATSLLK